MKRYYIEREHFYLYPLLDGQLEMYLKNDGSLEKELGIKLSEREIHPELKEAVESALLPDEVHPADCQFFTLWTIISKEENCIAGDLYFKGTPCQDGEVETGYYADPFFERKGFITEALEVLCSWVLSQQYVRSVKAATGKDNLAFQRVLQKSGFVCKGEQHGKLQWQLKEKNPVLV